MKSFVARYERGVPWDGYTDQEVLDRYRQVAPRLTLTEFAQGAQASLARLSMQDRLLFAQYLHGQAEWLGVQIAGMQGHDAEHRLREADLLAQTLTGIQRRQPALLEQLMGVQGDVIDSLLAKAVLAGIVAAGER